MTDFYTFFPFIKWELSQKIVKYKRDSCSKLSIQLNVGLPHKHNPNNQWYSAIFPLSWRISEVKDGGGGSWLENCSKTRNQVVREGGSPPGIPLIADNKITIQECQSAISCLSARRSVLLDLSLSCFLRAAPPQKKQAQHFWNPKAGEGKSMDLRWSDLNSENCFFLILNVCHCIDLSLIRVSLKNTKKEPSA